jgi:hypothetical protein
VSPRTLVVGARTARQGTGRFLAGALSAGGAEVCALVGTSESTATDARDGLARDFSIRATPYTDLAQALAAEQPDLVLLASPWQFHQQQLELIADAGCHCLVEKPMLWPGSEASAAAIVDRFASRNLLLDVVGQWPFALEQFEALHSTLPHPVESLTMRLSPISIDDSMIPDAAPHFVSLLQALVGPGDFADINIVRFGDGEQARLELNARFEHGTGAVAATLLLEAVAQRPRPAWFEINGLRAAREVVLPEYQQYLVAAGRRVSLPDPMHAVADAYLGRLKRGETTEVTRLLAAHRSLCQLAEAAATG